MTEYNFTVRAPDHDRDNGFVATAVMSITEDSEIAPALSYLRSPEFRRVFINEWARNNAPGFGVALAGGPRPIFRLSTDGTRMRENGLEAYEQDFRLTPAI